MCYNKAALVLPRLLRKSTNGFGSFFPLPGSEKSDMIEETFPPESRLPLSWRRIYAFLGRALAPLWRFLRSPHLTSGLLLAGALAFLLALAFPQLPPSIAADLASRARWLEALRDRYPVETLAPWGLFEIYSTFWLRSLLALLLLNLLVGLFARGEALWPSSRRPEIRPPTGEAPRRNFILKVSPEQALEALKDSLRRPLYRTFIEEREGEIHLYADRFRLPDWGLFFFHLGLVVMLGAAFYNTRAGWHEEGIRLMPGEAYQLAHAPGLAFRLDRFEKGDASGPTPGGSAPITLLPGRQGEQQATIGVGQPFFHRGVGIHLASSGTFVQVRGREAGGNPLLLQPLVKDSERKEEITLFFAEPRAERYFSVPEARLAFQVIFKAEGEERSKPDFAVRAFRPNEAKPLISEDFTEGEALEIEVEGARFHLRAGRYAVFHLSCEPGLFLLTFGGGMAVLGLALYLAFRRVRLWAAVRRQGQELTLELAGEENRIAFGEGFSAWALEVEKKLRESGRVEEEP